jgi:hypothetical protein
LASTLQYFTNVSYSIYETALVAEEDDANDTTAIASLGGSATNPVVGSDGVALSSALATVLGLATQAGSVGIAPSGAACLLGSPGCYNGRITVSDAANTWYFRSGAQPAGTYDFYSAVEHETDEVLGTVSCLVGDNNNASTITTSLNCRNGTPSLAVAAADLFRYGSPGVRSYLTSANGTGAYFSIDGGVTNVASYNNQPNGEDYGDWTPSPLRVQNAQGTPDKSGFDITNDGGSEIEVLDAVGYNLKTVTVPEPGTSGMLPSALWLWDALDIAAVVEPTAQESPAVTDRVKRLLSA